MRIIPALALLLLVAPAARAEDRVPEARVTPSIVRTSEVSTAPAQAEMRLDLVKAPEIGTANSDAAVQEMPSRGSFWWLVGVIVIAGVILAVLL